MRHKSQRDEPDGASITGNVKFTTQRVDLPQANPNKPAAFR